MALIRFLTSGESHGKALIGILEGIPSGFALSPEDIDGQLKRRQGGYGRGGRMKIESDHAEILSGVRWGKTTGAPIALMIENRDWKNWEEGMSPKAEHARSIKPVTRPRPGHADLAGVLKYDHEDIRNILERSSARETAMRVAIGAIARKVLSGFGIAIGSYVVGIGARKFVSVIDTASGNALLNAHEKAEASPVRCPDDDASKKMVRLIDKAIRDGNSLGGIFEVFVAGLPVGLGSHIQWDRKLDGRFAQALMSIQAMKGVEVGLGFRMAGRFGSEVMDEIFYSREAAPMPAKGKKNDTAAIHDSRFTSHGFYRKTNNAGGIEGGMSNGMPVIIRAAMKPIPTLRKPLMSADIKTKEAFEAAYERSDVCAVPAASVVGEAMAALVAADAFFEKFGGDSKSETRRNFDSYISYLRRF
jgi:chorismate synthase